jgi:AbrB family looped-hinge helix DNA binding protein
MIHYRGNIRAMPVASSKLTAQGQVSVPAEVRRRLGIGPGSVLEWVQEGDHFVVRRVGTYTSEQVHSALFPNKSVVPRTLEELKEGIRTATRNRHARG